MKKFQDMINSLLKIVRMILSPPMDSVYERLVGLPPLNTLARLDWTMDAVTHWHRTLWRWAPTNLNKLVTFAAS